jgi:Ca2+/Na+ antiporter
MQIFLYLFLIYVIVLIGYVCYYLIDDYFYYRKYGNYTANKFKLFNVKLAFTIGSVWPIVLIVFIYLVIKILYKGNK